MNKIEYEIKRNKKAIIEIKMKSNNKGNQNINAKFIFRSHFFIQVYAILNSFNSKTSSNETELLEIELFCFLLKSRSRGHIIDISHLIFTKKYKLFYLKVRQ